MWQAAAEWPAVREPAACTMTRGGETVVPVIALAGLRPPEQGGWLLITGTGQEPGGEFSGRLLPHPPPHAHGGDVLVKVSAHERHGGPELIRAQVVTAVSGRLILIGRWDTTELVTWPGAVRPAAAFAVATMDWLLVWQADIGAGTEVTLDVPDEEFTIARPWVPGAGLTG